MNIVTIFIKELLQDIRDIKTMILMILMPTIFTIILSIVVKEDVYTTVNLEDIKVYYTYSNNNELIENINFLKELGVKCSEYNKQLDINDGILIEEENTTKAITIKYKNDDNKIEAQLIRNLLRDKIEKENIAKDLYYNNIKIGESTTEGEAVALKSIMGENENTTLNYYGVTMVILTVMFGAISGAYKIIKENKYNTLNKIMSLPVRREEIIIGKILGTSITLLIQIILVLLISINLLKVNWGSNLIPIILLLYLEGLFFISMGTFIGSFLSEEKSAWIIILTIIMCIGLLSGLFIPIGTMGNSIIENISKLIPITHENNEIFNIIYGIKSSNVTKLMTIYSTSVAILIFITTMVMGEDK